MCLIHTLNADTQLSNGWLKNIHGKNPDGIGFMGLEDGQFVVKRYVPKNQRRALKWYRAHVEGRAGIVHWRYATHGTVNLDNCHPYKVLDKDEDGLEMWLMHNGVMDEYDQYTHLDDVGESSYFHGHKKRYGFGNETDNRSDTYHFIRVVILPLVKPSLGGNPKALMNPVVQRLIASLIGYSNKLAIMDSDGDQVIINEGEFVSWPAYGLICSNTYAWSHEARHYQCPSEYTAPVRQGFGDPRLATASTGISTTLDASRKFGALSYGVLNDRYEHDDESGELVLGGEALSPAVFEEQYTEHCREMHHLYDDTVAVFPNIGAALDANSFIEYADMFGTDTLKAMVRELMDQHMTEVQFADEIGEQVKM